ncbi:hypothetical protein THAOC_00325 [Thalassiosira oceanica]|uniref:Uncharacterized protein n=1 Tax=Thalassiosira oceanica TaxID=159749 RepID=K0TRH7_THAOC|nr:hypothetical protein THAOC_00325 [Thalassiosira oceanica]|eukprot:EJK77817.1 hypothetical protein THAOC_00325 [Thalassiosira oceanica]
MHGSRSGFSYATSALVTEDLQRDLDALHGDKIAKAQANKVYGLPSIEQSIHCMHTSLGYPAAATAATWLTACRKGILVGFPFADVKYIRKYYPETTETPAQATSTCNDRDQPSPNLRHLNKWTRPASVVRRSETYVYIKVYEAKNTIFSDRPDRPATSPSRRRPATSTSCS